MLAKVAMFTLFVQVMVRLMLIRRWEKGVHFHMRPKLQCQEEYRHLILWEPEK